MTQISVLVLAVLASAAMAPALQQPQGPPRPSNKLIVSGTVYTAQHQPVARARIVADLMRVDRTDTALACPQRQAAQRNAESAATGQFEVLFQSPGPQFDACLVVAVFAPSESGLKDTVVSGQRVRFQLPDPRTHEVSTVRVDIVLRQ
jgi:hypothetical protein